MNCMDKKDNFHVSQQRTLTARGRVYPTLWRSLPEVGTVGDGPRSVQGSSEPMIYANTQTHTGYFDHLYVSLNVLPHQCPDLWQIVRERKTYGVNERTGLPPVGWGMLLVWGRGVELSPQEGLLLGLDRREECEREPCLHYCQLGWLILQYLMSEVWEGKNDELWGDGFWMLYDLRCLSDLHFHENMSHLSGAGYTVDVIVLHFSLTRHWLKLGERWLWLVKDRSSYLM